MSKLARNIAIKQGKRIAIESPMRAATIETNVAEIPALYDAFQYSIGVTFGVRAQVLRKDLHQIADKARRVIIEDVFGEFRPLIMAVYEAQCDRDYRKAMDALNELEQRMFGDD